MTRRFVAPDGVELAADVFGPPSGRLVVMTSGMGQTRRSWYRAARRMADEGLRVVTLDTRGHGQSGWSADGDYGYGRLAGDVIAVVSALGGPAVLVGASLGGKIALVAAGEGGPGIAAALALVDTVPRTNPKGVADVTPVLRPPKDGFSGLKAAAIEIARLRGDPYRPGAAARLRQHMRRDAAGRWHWHWDPALMSRDHGLGVVAALTRLEGAAAKLTVPVLLARCERSEVVDDAGEAALRALVPQLRTVVIGGARHMIVGDENDAFADAVIDFIDGLRM